MSLSFSDFNFVDTIKLKLIIFFTKKYLLQKKFVPKYRNFYYIISNSMKYFFQNNLKCFMKIC